MIDGTRMVFFNIAWMREYQGDWQNDVPIHGGRWIEENKWGGEVYNFQPFKGKMYGYVEPGSVEGKQRHLNLSNLSNRPGGIKSTPSLSGVLVVWVATPKNGTEPLVVGWYKDATVYSGAQIPPPESGRKLPHHNNPGEYFASARQENCVLLPPRERTLGIPGKGRGFGRSNIWYAESSEGQSAKSNVLRFIQEREISEITVDPAQYYVIGTKYYHERSKTWEDIFPRIRERNVVSVGWAQGIDLGTYYGKSQDKIVNYLKSKNEGPASYNTLKLFLNLKPGDRIALKDSGSPKGTEPYLSIRAYAIVVEREGTIYEYDPKGLGHLINVEYIEDLFLELPLGGYGRTVQRVTKPEYITKIFGYYSSTAKGYDPKGTVDKRNIGKQHRSGAADYVVDRAHNRLQQEVFEYLSSIQGNEVVMEKGNVDIIVKSGTKTTFYEIKAYNSAKQCLREALGQIIEYSWFKNSERNKLNLIIVGPRKPTQIEKEYINYIKSSFQQSITFADFEDRKLTVN